MTSVDDVSKRPPGSRRATKLRTTQIEDEIWLPALRIADLRGETLAAVMRDAVKRYEARHRHMLTEQDKTPDA